MLSSNLLEIVKAHSQGDQVYIVKNWLCNHEIYAHCFMAGLPSNASRFVKAVTQARPYHAATKSLKCY